MLDEILVKSRKFERRKKLLESAKTALQANSSNEDVMTAVGIRPVQRPKM
jgi:hypothetical protein